VMFVLGVFCLARQFVARQEIALLATFFAAVAPRFVDTSYWNASARAPFVVLVVLVIMVAFRVAQTRQASLYVVFVPLFLGCFFVHHMAVLFALFALAYLLSAILVSLFNKPSVGVAISSRKRTVAGLSLAFVAIAEVVGAFKLLDYFKANLDTTFGSTSLFSIEPTYLSVILNLAASYVNQVGFILAFAVLGIPLFLRRSRFRTETLFLLALPMLFIPVITDALYISMLLTPYLAILGAATIGTLVGRAKHRRPILFVVVLLISASLFLPGWSIDRWNGEREMSGYSVEVDDQFFNDGNYLREYEYEAFAVSNDDLISRRLSGISETIFLWSGVESALSGDVTQSSVKENLTWAEEKFPRNLYLWFTYGGDPQVDLRAIMIVLRGVEYASGGGDTLPSGEGFFESHEKILVAVDNNWPNQYVWVWGIVDAELPEQLRNARWSETMTGRSNIPLESYNIYSSELITLYALRIPQS